MASAHRGPREGAIGCRGEGRAPEVIEIDWLAFVQVFVAALIASLLVVGFYAHRPAAARPRPDACPVVAPAEFTDAITRDLPTRRRARRRPRRRPRRSSP